MTLISVREAAQGRWRGILPALGIDARHLTGKHGPCPLCGGRDRFRFDDQEGRGTWICSHCGAGDGVALVMAATGLQFRDAAIRIEDMVGTAPRQPKPEQSGRDQREAMNRLWRSSKPVQAGDPVALYLERRVGLVSFPSVLRTAAATPYHGDGVSLHPAMIAMVSGPEGVPATLHRTFLSADGTKASVESPRRLMPGQVPKGSAVRLYDEAAELGIAEGIETAFAAASLFGIPTWAALTAGLMADWTPPDMVRSVVVFGDCDASFTGQSATFALARRLATKGLTVRVEIPDQVGTDWADVLVDNGRFYTAREDAG